MNDKKQPKKSMGGRRGGRALRAVVEAVGECVGKGSFDYQRIVVCVAGGLGECAEFARECRLALSRAVLRGKSRDCGPVVVVEVGVADGRELLVAAVRAVNQRRAVVVLVTTAEERRRWGEEAGRIRRRTHVVLRVGEGRAKIEG